VKLVTKYISLLLNTIDAVTRKFKFMFKSNLPVFGVKFQDLPYQYRRNFHDEDVDIDIVTVQETHAGSEENIHKRGTLPGYTLVGAVYSNVHGTATYVKASFLDYHVVIVKRTFQAGITIVNFVPRI
jgi:hypothetical protein